MRYTAQILAKIGRIEMLKKQIRLLAILSALVLSVSFSLSWAAEGIEKDAAFYNKKGEAYYEKGYLKYAPKGKTEEAKEAYGLAELEFKKALDSDPSFFEAHINLARLFSVQRKYEQAAASYQDALNLEPGNLEIAVRLANALFLMGEHDQALEILIIVRDRTTNPDLKEKINTFIDKIRASQ